jgi:hypothetical protein
MQDRNVCVASTVQEATTGFTRPVPRRVPIGDKRGTSAQPQLLVLAASLLLWTLIITTATIVFS